MKVRSLYYHIQKLTTQQDKKMKPQNPRRKHMTKSDFITIQSKTQATKMN